jgi:uncharacterized protein YndB with AHSA1/START domain
MSTEFKKRDLVVTRIFEAPVERVWKAWLDPADVMQWWGPQGFTCPVAKMDFREGGTSLVCMRAPQEFGGQDFYNAWSYQEIEPLERIEYLFIFTDENGEKIDPTTLGLPEDLPHEMRHVVTFKPLGMDKTEMTVTEFGYLSAETLEISRAGLEQCLDKMAGIFAKD